MANGKVCDACANGTGCDGRTPGHLAGRTSDASAATTTTACK